MLILGTEVVLLMVSITRCLHGHLHWKSLTPEPKVKCRHRPVDLCLNLAQETTLFQCLWSHSSQHPYGGQAIDACWYN